MLTFEHVAANLGVSLEKRGIRMSFAECLVQYFKKYTFVAFSSSVNKHSRDLNSNWYILYNQHMQMLDSVPQIL